jgi:SGNH domain (fused to AT3 domains)
VRPRPSIAQITPNAPCERVRRYGPVHPCAFGTGRGKAVDTIALIGDSHASHWRAAVEVAARAKRWHGLSITSGVCPVSKSPWLLPEPELSQCLRWNRAVLGWLSRHPKVTTVFQSQIVSHRNVSARLGEDQFAAKVRGYIEEWKAFPRSVRHIIVIRDDPRTSYKTAGCVMRARAHRHRPGIACAATRAWALQRDPVAAAARQAHSRRVQLIDLTRFMCDERRCFAVVGGALVHKDINHLTRVFATTLGPYLLRKLNRLSAKWRHPH